MRIVKIRKIDKINRLDNMDKHTFVSPDIIGSSYCNTVSEIYKINTIEGFPMKKISNYDLTPCDVIFNHVQKPDGYMFCKSINIYDDRWRVNLYSKCERHGIDSKFISNSYFVSFNKDSGNMAVLS